MWEDLTVYDDTTSQMEQWKSDLDERVRALNEGQEFVREIIREAKESTENPSKRKRVGEQAAAAAPPAAPAAGAAAADAPAAMETDGGPSVPASEPDAAEPSPEDRQAAAVLIGGSVAKAKHMADTPKGKGKADAAHGKGQQTG